MLRFARLVLAVFALVFTAAFVVPMIHWQQWVEAHGWQKWVEGDGVQRLLQQMQPYLTKLADATETTTFLFTTGFLIGGALLVWVDFGVRQRTRKMGLILASVGLATFVIGVGIYLFPRPNRYAIAATTPAAVKPKEPEREPLAWSKTPILRWTQEADGMLYAHALGFVGKNISTAEVQVDAIYVVSRATNARIDLKVQIENEGAVAAEDTNPIPPDAYIQLTSDELNPSAGIAEADFLRDWGAIDFVAEYGGAQHRVAFEPGVIAALFDARRPKPMPPAVTRKSDSHLTATANPDEKTDKSPVSTTATVQPVTTPSSDVPPETTTQGGPRTDSVREPDRANESTVSSAH